MNRGMGFGFWLLFSCAIALLVLPSTLPSCKSGNKTVISKGQPFVADTDPIDDPDEPREGSGEILFNNSAYNLSRIILDVDTLRKASATLDSAIVASVDEVIAVDYGTTQPTQDGIPVSINANEVWAEDFDGDGVDDILAGGAPRGEHGDTVSIILQSEGEYEETETILSDLKAASTVFPFYLDYYDVVMDILATDTGIERFIGEYRPTEEYPIPSYFSCSTNIEGIYGSCAAKADMDLNEMEDVVVTVFKSVYYEIGFGYHATIEWDEYTEDNPIDQYDQRAIYSAITTGKWMPIIPYIITATNDPAVLTAIDEETISLSPYRVCLGDFNGDELPDVALLCKSLTNEMPITIGPVTYDTDSFLLVHLNNGQPEVNEITLTFTLSQAELLGPTSEDIGTADFDLDGNLDLVVSVSGAPYIATARGNGDGTFEDFVYHSTGSQYTYRLAIGDFDEEEGKDVVMTCPLSQSLLFFLNNSEFAEQDVG
jgi:hypothetical protein